MKKNIGKLLLLNEKHGFSYVAGSTLRSLGLCAALTSIGITSQAATITWDGGAGTPIMNTAANWTGDIAPIASADVAAWDGTVTGPLSLTWNGTFGAGFGSVGISLLVGAGQTSSLSVVSDSTNTGVNADNINLGNITIEAGAGAFTLGDGIGFDHTVLRSDATNANVFTNNSSNTATISSQFYFNSGGGADRRVTFTGSGNWHVGSALRFSNGPVLTVVKEGAGTLSTSSPATAGNATNFIINAGTVAVTGAGLLGGNAAFPGTIANNAAFTYESSAAQTLSGVISGTGTLTQTAGALTLTGVNTYTGATTVTGGTLTVGGAGDINTSSGLVVNGAGAIYSHTSSVPSNHTVALTNGTVAGTGTIAAVSVPNNLGSVVSHGVGGTGVLTIGSLAFQGAGSISVTKSATPAAAEIVVSGSLTTTPGVGKVRLNASQSFWDSGVFYNLVSAGGFAGSASDFVTGTISGLTSRQSATVEIQSGNIGLTIAGDTPRWTGANGGAWDTSATGNWQLIIGGTPTTFINGDLSLFDDNATSASVTIGASGVSPSLARFNNSTLDYTVGGAGGIAGGSLVKDGSARLTITTANSYTGGTTINAGTIQLTGAGTLGAATGAVTVNAGTIDLGTTSQSFGTVTLAGEGSLTGGTITSGSVVGANTTGIATLGSVLSGTTSLAVSGVGGTLNVSGTNTNTGGTTVSGGTLALVGTGTLGDATASALVSGGVLDLGTNSQTLSALTLTGPGTVQNGTLTAPIVASLSAGTAVIDAAVVGESSVSSTVGGGTLALSGANTYTGATIATLGTIQIGNGEDTGSINPASPISVGVGAFFGVNRFDAVAQGTHFGVITGAGALSKRGAGVLTLNAANTYTGTTQHLGGTIEVTANGALGTGPVNINGFGNRLHLVGGVTLANTILAGGGGVVENVSGNNRLTGPFQYGNVGSTTTEVRSTAGTFTLDGDFTIAAQLDFSSASRRFNFVGAGDFVVNGAIHNSLTVVTNLIGLDKNGVGTLRLNGVNDYTGTTFAYNGVLRVDGSLVTNSTTNTASEVTVELDGTLAGTGSIAGTTSVYGNLRPSASGEAGGRLRFGGSLYLDTFATTRFDFAGATFTGVTSTLNAGVTFGGTLRLNFASGVYNGSYPLFELTGASGGDFQRVFLTTGLDTDLPLVVEGSVWSVQSNGITYSFDEATGILNVTGGLDAVVPGATTLSAVAGNASVNLSWAAATNADSYVLQRSTTSGGPYTTIGNGLGGLSYTDSGLENGTTYYYVLKAKDSASGLTGPTSSEMSATPSAPLFSALQGWRFENFGVYDDDETVLAGDSEDFDGDGLANLVEYAVGSDAKVAGVSPVTIGRSTDFLTLTYPRRSPADDSLVYTVEASSDLAAGFTPGAGSTETVGSVSTYTDTVAVGTPGVKRFLRLSVSSTPAE